MLHFLFHLGIKLILSLLREPCILLSTIVNPSVVIVSKSVEPVNVPLGFVAVTLPVMFMLPVPVISLLLGSKFPPSWV